MSARSTIAIGVGDTVRTPGGAEHVVESRTQAGFCRLAGTFKAFHESDLVLVAHPAARATPPATRTNPVRLATTADGRRVLRAAWE